MSARRILPWVVVALLVVALACVPFVSATTGGFLPYELNSPGSLQVLALVLVTAALAVSFDLVFGYTGLISFGHALFFTLGGYGFVMALVHTDLGFGAAVVVGLAAATVGGLLVNSVALRVAGLSFAMVTLAFAELVSIGIGRNYWGTGGEEGLTLPYQKMPEQLIGIVNTRNIYWLALATLVIVVAVAVWATSTRLGRMWQAIRENDLRVNVMGINTYAYKLVSTGLSAFLAGACGVAYVIVLGGAVPHMTGLMFSLSLIVMVVIGGRGRVWGAVLGATIYVFLEQRLPVLAASEGVAGLPEAVRIPLSEPQLLLGVAFIALIFFLPGGIAGMFAKLRNRAESR
ncbi:branched-chain amino acid ABC transporter permease [Mumia sp. DW29H23]|uniref:branched-chain amino acid ABC transporter permease n=1 Tax=Mumia sp. DW29H23 TaxID=3421241 RepID=UPI003D69E7B2